MYCKNCGKEITADSKFCQHCGTAQQEAVNETTPIVEQPKEKKVLEIPTIKTNLSNKTKNVMIVYVIWVLINFLLIFLDYKPFKEASKAFYLYDFDAKYVEYYDISEFLVYAIIIPLVIFTVYKLWLQKKINKNK